MKIKDRYEKVKSVTTKGIIKSYPQKYIKTKKIKIINNKVDYTSSIELLDKVKTNKLIENYDKRIKNMSYKILLLSWKEFEYDFDKWLGKLFDISTEEGNTLSIIAKRNIKHKICIK